MIRDVILTQELPKYQAIPNHPIQGIPNYTDNEPRGFGCLKRETNKEGEREKEREEKRKGGGKEGESGGGLRWPP